MFSIPTMIDPNELEALSIKLKSRFKAINQLNYENKYQEVIHPHQNEA